METRSRGIRTEAGKETHEAFFLQTLTFTWRCWQAPRKYPTH
jgi:hypothetical protein